MYRGAAAGGWWTASATMSTSTPPSWKKPTPGFSAAGFWASWSAARIPGVRIITVIACGLFRISPARFLSAQFAGISIYMAILLAVGYFVGPKALESIKLPTISLHLVLTTLLALALPLVLRRLNRKTADDDTRTIQNSLTSRERVLADLLAGFVGMVELASIWIACASLSNLMARDELQRAALALARWVNASHFPSLLAYVLDYLVALIICLLAAVIFFQGLMPRLRIEPRRLGYQTLALWIFMLLVTMGMIAVNLFNHLLRPIAAVSIWFSRSGGVVLGIIVLGLLGYAYVAAQTRRLAIDQFADDPEIAPSVSESLAAPSAAPEAELAAAPAEQPRSI